MIRQRWMVVCSPLMQAKQDGSIGIYNLSEEFVCWRCQSLAKQRLIPAELTATSLTPMIVHVRFISSSHVRQTQRNMNVLSSPVLADFCHVISVVQFKVDTLKSMLYQLLFY